MHAGKGLRGVLAGLLVVSAVLFAFGSAVERSRSHEVAPAASPSVSEGQTTETGGETTGETGGETASAHTAEAGSETLFGVNPESTGLVVVAVVLALLLAAAVWLRASRPVLLVTVVFGVVFAAFDIREALHQSNESRAGLVALAVGLAAIHLAISATGGSLLRTSGSEGAGATA